jgi:hypothetical protein
MAGAVFPAKIGGAPAAAAASCLAVWAASSLDASLSAVSLASVAVMSKAALGLAVAE